MSKQETLRKLSEMGLSAMAELYQELSQNSSYRDMDFDELFSLLTDSEYDRRKSNKLARLIKRKRQI